MSNTLRKAGGYVGACAGALLAVVPAIVKVGHTAVTGGDWDETDREVNELYDKMISEGEKIGEDLAPGAATVAASMLLSRQLDKKSKGDEG